MHESFSMDELSLALVHGDISAFISTLICHRDADLSLPQLELYSPLWIKILTCVGPWVLQHDAGGLVET